MRASPNANLDRGFVAALDFTIRCLDRSAIEILAYRNCGAMFLGDLDQSACHVNGIPRGRDLLMSGGSEARKDDLAKMRSDPWSETATRDGR